ncbi:hypothetical protein GOV13_05035 [Candidatus Pacearchaeota archaeon]|nr:hypothetical protein [Candidatus Pacearchaeota archaeon]
MKKKNWWTIAIIIGVLVLAYVILSDSPPETDEEVAKCIGAKSTLYVQSGCHACEVQEKMFGDNYQHLNTIDCFYEREKCGGIEYTPTWLIDGEKYRGVQSIDKLKELTGCQKEE